MDMENGITKDESKAIAEFITEIYKFKIDNKIKKQTALKKLTIYIEERECAVMKSEEIGEKFEEEFGNKSDYFNHRIGLFMEMKNWIVKQCEDAMLI